MGGSCHTGCSVQFSGSGCRDEEPTTAEQDHGDTLTPISPQVSSPMEAVQNAISRLITPGPEHGREFCEALDHVGPDDGADGMSESQMEEVRMEQMRAITAGDGFLVNLAQSGVSARALLQAYGVVTSECSEQQISDHMQELRSQVASHMKFGESQLAGVVIPKESLGTAIGALSTARYLWQEKQVVPILDLESGVVKENDGVRLTKAVPDLDALLERAAASGVFGARTKSIITDFNAKGIKALVNQQFRLSKTIMAKGLMPMLRIDVDLQGTPAGPPEKAPPRTLRRLGSELPMAMDQTVSGSGRQTPSGPADSSEIAVKAQKVEGLLVELLLAKLRSLNPDEKLMLELSFPVVHNVYLPIIQHPNTVRVAANSGLMPRKEACKRLAKNFGMVAVFGKAFLEGLSQSMSQAAFTAMMETSLAELYESSMAVPVKEVQIAKVATAEGFFACLDLPKGSLHTEMARLISDEAGALDKLHTIHSQILTSAGFNGERVIGLLMDENTAFRQIYRKPVPKYLWEDKHIVPFMSLDHGLAEEKDGVQVPREVPNLTAVLDKAAVAGIYGVGTRSVIKAPNKIGIAAAIDQQVQISKRIAGMELAAFMYPEVDAEAADKAACETLLLDILAEKLHLLRNERVILCLAFPHTANFYLPLLGHPNVIRIVAPASHLDRAVCCQLMQDNIGVSGGFRGALVEGLQSGLDFDEKLKNSCETIFQGSLQWHVKKVQEYMVANQNGFFAALAHLAANTSAAIATLDRYGISDRLDQVQAVYTRIITNPQFNSCRVVGVSFTPNLLDMQVDQLPLARYIWEKKHIVPFLQVDTAGLSPEANGVQKMAEPAGLDAMLDQAVQAGVFGTTSLTIISRPHSKGVHSAIDQQLTLAKRIIAKGLVPVLMIFVNKDTRDKEQCERMVRQILLSSLRKKLQNNEQIVLNFNVPSTPNLYRCFTSHERVLRVLASTGGHKTEVACSMLTQNTAVVANFGASLLQGLNIRQTEDEFTRCLGRTCSTIHEASRAGAAIEENPQDAASE